MLDNIQSFTRMKKTEEIVQSFKFPLSVLEKLYIFSDEDRSKKVTLVKSFFVISLLFLFIVTLSQSLLLKEGVLELVELLEVLCLLGIFLAKMSVIAFQGGNLTPLIRNVSKFWKTDRCTGIVKLQLDNILSNNLRLQKVYLVSMMVSLATYLSSPLFGKDIPFGVWKLEGHDYLYKIVLFVEMVVLLPATMFLVAFDCIFLSFCTEIIVQFRILCECFRKLGAKNTLSLSDEEAQKQQHDMMTSYIRHHVFLFKFLEDLRNFYSLVFMIVCGTIAPIICGEMYATLESPSLRSQLQHGLRYITCTLQMAFYFMSVDHATSEGLLVANSIFNSDWYTNNAVRKSVLFVIQRSQKQFVFTAARLFEVNSRTVLNVVKVSWSLCTVMRAVNQQA